VGEEMLYVGKPRSRFQPAEPIVSIATVPFCVAASPRLVADQMPPR